MSVPCFVPSFEPDNDFSIIIERNREVIEDVMDEEIDENDEDDNIDENGLETMPFEIVERNRKDVSTSYFSYKGCVI